ncbi:FAD-binding and (Fe-S)-binding domain-containing protein [Campylobacter sp. MG1]|uniref:FAD-binding and (Fe-S)-binding domain-containing protein n=1 Tax=Campylobacter sp. MG1 TaxID=2976332 RepID=UPI00226D0FBD|nr:FAD-binding and (Fe-S)-binding domain-containing protein [Campylobacter sp. MG1]
MNNFENFFNDAKHIFKDRIFNDYLRCFAYGIDASCYHYVPKVVVIANNEEEVKTIITLANKHKTPVCFRAAGTSLSGQSSCDTILVIIKFSFKKIAISEDAKTISLGCGVVGINANYSLKNLRKKIGPDPATINSALIGGIINNNSSGMCCGVKDNSYKTLKSIRVILNDGSVLDTGDEESIANFRKTHANLLQKISDIKNKIKNDEELYNLIKRKFKIKNTTGYSINSFIDFDDEIDILAHLFVGSEGTLGFVSEVRLNTIDDLEFKACALLFFNTIQDAANTISEFAKFDFINSAEIMDYSSLKAVSAYPELKDLLGDIKNGNTCVLIQTENNDETILDKNIEKIKEISQLSYKSYFSKDSKEFDLWWKIRKGLLPIAAGIRKPGATVITEDICFEIKDLANGITSIQELFNEFGFADNGIIFGHALAGNIHFIITPNLNDKKEFENFAKLVEKMSSVVASYGGSIKAEHGTGRMVAPFVELEWGKKAYEINCKVKEIFDENNIFNPDVIITKDKEIYKKNIKQPSIIDEKLNICMECGFCERFCPSNEHTITPRQRIAILREIERLEKLNNEDSNKKLKDIRKNYKYCVDTTCAACGICSVVCPLGINFADFSIDYRKKNVGAISKFIANLAYNNHPTTLGIAKFSLGVANQFGNDFLDNTLSALHMPQSRKYLPEKNNFKTSDKKTDFNILYFTSCLNKAFKPNKKLYDKRPLQEVFENLCKKANIGVIYPPKDLCCGKAYENFQDIQDKNKEKLKKYFAEQKLIIVSDHSACSSKLILNQKESEIYDLSEFLLKFVAPKLKIKKIDEEIAIYTMCAMRKLKKENVLKELASLCTNKKIYEDVDTYCCAFAGYKGFLTPKLNISATNKFKAFFSTTNIKRGFSTSSTCEVGLADATNMSWQHIAYLLDECSE